MESTLKIQTQRKKGNKPTVEAVLIRMGSHEEDPCVLIRDLMNALRPRSRHAIASATLMWRSMVRMLEENADYRRAAADVVLKLFSEREQRSLYTEAGLLPNTGFFSELRRKLSHKLLPEVLDERNLKDCVRMIFPKSRDLEWLQSIPEEDRRAFWVALSHVPPRNWNAHLAIRAQLLDSAVILGHRIAAMGLEPELVRVLPRLARGESPFIALCDEVALFAEHFRHTREQTEITEEDERHLFVLLAQCLETAGRAHQVAATKGTSFALTFLVVRLHQHLQRFESLMRVLAGRYDDKQDAERWSDFLRGAIEGELQRNSVRKHVADLLVLLSLRVTENAARTGEHYIARNRAELIGILRAAAGAGFLIAFMALLKIRGASLDLALLNQGFMNGAIYGVGFAVIHLCHGIVATKQPAMTAAAIAATVSQTRGRLRDVERLAELVFATIRGQNAAIAGNVLVAFPLAVAVSLAIQQQIGGNPIAATKALTILTEIDPLSGPTLFYAAVAGFWLFMAGLVSGYVDNLAAYGQFGDRVARHPWMLLVAGTKMSGQFGAYLDRNAGGLAGNLFFGLMLGLTPTIGIVTGLPLDIRHIAFSAANFGYSLVALDFHMSTMTIVRSAIGLLLIGAVNLFVSFNLALWVALRSRNLDFSCATPLLLELWRRARTKLAFIFPHDREEV